MINPKYYKINSPQSMHSYQITVYGNKTVPAIIIDSD